MLTVPEFEIVSPPVPFAVDDAIPIAYNSRRLAAAAAMSLVELYLNRFDLNIAKFVS